MTPDGPDRDAVRVLVDLATLGPAFAVAAGPAPDGPAGWRPLVELATDPEELASRVSRTRERLGVTEDRVAASVVFQGLAARVVAPLLGAAALHDRLLLLTVESLYWRSWEGGVVPLWVGAPRSVALTPDRLADAVAAPLALLVASVRGQVRVSERLLWGNVGASVARRTCCLFYRAPGAVTCSDCVFGAGREGPAPNTRPAGTGSRRPGRPGGGSSR